MTTIRTTCTMCVAITTVLPPHHQALLRSAGSTGTSAYNEVVEQSGASMYIETDGSILVDDGKDRVPCILPLPADVGVLVVRVGDRVSSMGALVVRPVTRVRYEGSPDAIKIQGTSSYRSQDDNGGVKDVELIGCEGVITIGNFFLYGHVSLVIYRSQLFQKRHMHRNGF